MLVGQYTEVAQRTGAPTQRLLRAALGNWRAVCEHFGLRYLTLEEIEERAIRETDEARERAQAILRAESAMHGRSYGRLALSAIGARV